MLNAMKPNLNLEYIRYKMLFITSAFNQSINKNLVKLLIKVNDRIYFPEFIFYGNYGNSSYEIYIKIKRLADIVHKILKLIHNKRNEINS